MTESYVRPEVLVETAWVAEHLKDPRIRIVESDEDILLYDVGHIPGLQLGAVEEKLAVIVRANQELEKFHRGRAAATPTA